MIHLKNYNLIDKDYPELFLEFDILTKNLGPKKLYLIIIFQTKG